MESSSQLLLTASFFRGVGIPLTSHPVNMSVRTPWWLMIGCLGDDTSNILGIRIGECHMLLFFSSHVSLPGGSPFCSSFSSNTIRTHISRVSSSLEGHGTLWVETF